MGFIFGIIKRLIKLAIYFTLFATIIVFIPNLPPYTKFTAIKLEPTQPQVGPLAPNGALNNAERLYNKKLHGPEAFQVYNGEVYTSLATGEIVKLSPGGHITFVTQIGRPCAGLHQEHICGRPLGFVIDEKKNILYVADSYHGIWLVDLKTGKKQLLVSPTVAIDGRQPKLFNSVALDKNGELYWTDSSSDFHLRDGVYSLVTDPSGRLFHYNAANNKSNVLLDDLWFANGVAVSFDSQFVVVSETGCFRLRKYYINGPKKGQSEVFIAGLPGVPDNLRALPDGSGVLVGLFTTFDNDHPMIFRSMSEAPLARKFIARLIRLIEIPFEYLNNLYPHVILEEIIHNIGNFRLTSKLQWGTSGLIQLDWNGNVVASYYNTDGTFPSISDAIVYNDKLYLGAPHNIEYIGSVPAPPALKKAFSSKLSDKDAKVPPKMSEQKIKENPKVEEKKTPPKVEKPVVPEPKQKPQPQQQAKPVPPKQPEVRSAPAPTENKPKAKVEPTVKAPNVPSGGKDKNTASQPQKPVKVNPPKPPVNKPVPEQIPIKEEIPSDTIKPNKETLKVIKKDGPTEIPNPNV